MVTALITGASSGLGREYINAIIEQYPSIDAFWLVARSKDALKQVAEEHPDKTIAAISLDLSKDESIDAMEQLLKENNPEIKVLVNNAGFGKCTDFFSSVRGEQTGMVDLNCKGLTALTRLCLPYMLDDSLVLNISSIAAFAPTPRMSVYCATKSYVLADQHTVLTPSILFTRCKVSGMGACASSSRPRMAVTDRPSSFHWKIFRT